MCFSFGRWRLETSWSHGVSDETCDFRVFFANETINHDETCNMSAFVVHLRSLKQILFVMVRRSWTLIWKSFQIFLTSWMMVMGKSPQRSFFVSVLSTALPSSFSFLLIFDDKKLQAVQSYTQVDFWQWKSQWDVSLQTSFWYFFQEHAYCIAVLWRCLKTPFMAAFLCRFCLGLTRLQGVAMSRDMLRCTSRNKQLNTRFDEVRDCSWADKLDVGRRLVNPQSATQWNKGYEIQRYKHSWNRQETLGGLVKQYKTALDFLESESIAEFVVSWVSFYIFEVWEIKWTRHSAVWSWAWRRQTPEGTEGSCAEMCNSQRMKQ